MRLHPRVGHLEARPFEKSLSPTLLFIWAGSHGDMAIEEGWLQHEGKN